MKKAIAILLLVLVVFVVGRTTTLAENKVNTGEIKIWFQSANSTFTTLNVVDSTTGVQYIVVSGGCDSWGNRSIAICPRYNSNGTFYTGK